MRPDECVWVVASIAWGRLAKPRERLLRETDSHPVSIVHMRELTPGSPRGEYADWSREDYDRIIKGVVDILADRDRGQILNLYAVGCTIVVDKWSAELPKWSPTTADLYLFCYEGCFQ